MKLLLNGRVGLVAFGLLAGGFVTASVLGKTSNTKQSGEKPESAKPVARQTAHEIDELIAAEVFTKDTKLAPRIDDATYLRRVWLDIVGDIPTPEHVTAFVLDPAKDKRERVVNELLDKPQYGQSWSRYWRDVILSRRLEDRAQLVSNALVADLTEKLNKNESWDKIATEFITATGDIRENGATAIQAAQDARTEETTAEMSHLPRHPNSMLPMSQPSV